MGLLLGQPHVHGAGAVGVSAQVTLALQGAELVVHRRGGLQPHRIADLADAGWVAILVDPLADDPQHLSLPSRQPGIREGADLRGPVGGTAVSGLVGCHVVCSSSGVLPVVAGRGERLTGVDRCPPWSGRMPAPPSRMTVALHAMIAKHMFERHAHFSPILSVPGGRQPARRSFERVFEERAVGRGWRG